MDDNPSRKLENETEIANLLYKEGGSKSLQEFIIENSNNIKSIEIFDRAGFNGRQISIVVTNKNGTTNNYRTAKENDNHKNTISECEALGQTISSNPQTQHIQFSNTISGSNKTHNHPISPLHTNFATYNRKRSPVVHKQKEINSLHETHARGTMSVMQTVEKYSDKIGAISMYNDPLRTNKIAIFVVNKNNDEYRYIMPNNSNTRKECTKLCNIAKVFNKNIDIINNVKNPGLRK